MSDLGNLARCLLDREEYVLADGLSRLGRNTHVLLLAVLEEGVTSAPEGRRLWQELSAGHRAYESYIGKFGATEVQAFLQPVHDRIAAL